MNETISILNFWSASLFAIRKEGLIEGINIQIIQKNVNKYKDDKESEG